MPLDLVRRATDERVVDALLGEGELTRAEIAATAGVSKPTASESVRRLAERGVVQEAGRQEGGRGRAGTYCRISPGAGLALAVHAGAGLLVGECVDAAGEVGHRVQRHVGATIDAARLQRELLALVAELERRVGRPVPDRAVSIADPVDLDGRLVDLPGSPFVLGEGDLRLVMGERGVVDNDVHWAALAELGAGAPESFFYVHLGAGLGAAVVDGGEVVRGRGVAGEIAHVVTAGADGAAVPLLEALTAARPAVGGSTALDVGAVEAALLRDPEAVLGPLAGALASCVALLDPEALVVGGPWGPAALAAGLAAAVRARTHRPVEVRSAGVDDAPLAGARLCARELARAALLDHRP